MLCPNLKKADVKAQFEELVEALGEPLAYLVYNRNNGNFLDKTATGEDSELFKKILDKTGDRTKAIQSKAKMYATGFGQDTSVSTDEGLKNIMENNSPTNEDDALFRYAKPGEYQKWDREKELAWFKDNFPQVDIEVVNGLIEVNKHGGEKAWGMFKNAMVYISDQAKVGTTYHEAFHTVFHLFLTQQEQLEVLKEARGNRNISFLQAEEELADQLSDYIISQGEIKPIGQRILNFFKKIYEIIRYNITGNLSVDQLFSRINEGYYKDKPFTRSVSNVASVVRYSSKMTYQEEDARSTNVADAMRRFLDREFLNYPKKSRADFVKDFMGSTQKRYKADGKAYTVRGIDILLEKAFNGLRRYYEVNQETLSDRAKSQILETLQGIVKLNPDGSLPQGRATLNRIGDLALRKLARTEQLVFETKGGLYSGLENPNEEAVTDLQEDQTQLEGWQIDNVRTSRRAGASSEVRKEISYIPQLDNQGKQMVDELGLPKYLPSALTYATIIKEVQDIYHPDVMVERFKEFAQFKPEYKGIADKLDNDQHFKTLFWQAFQNTHAPFRVMTRKYNAKTKSYSYRWGISNKSGITNTIIDEWRNNYYSPTKNKLVNNRGEFTPSKEIEDLFDKVESKKDSFNDLSNLLTSIGIEVSTGELMALKDVKSSKRGQDNMLEAFWSEMKPLVKLYLDGVNPFKEGREEGKRLKSAAYYLTKVRPALQESSHISVEGKTYYSNIVSFFVSKQIQNLKDKETRNDYLNDPFYKTQPWLTRMHNEEGRASAFYEDEFEYALLDGKRWEDGRGKSYSAMSPKELELVDYNAFMSAKNFGWYRMPTLSDAPTAIYIKAERFEKEDDVVDHLYQVSLGEYNRIKNAPLLEREFKNYKDNAKKFHFIPTLNGKKNLFKEGKESEIKDVIRKYLNDKRDEAVKDFKNLNIIQEVNGKLSSTELGGTDAEIRKNITEYSNNYILANTQMTSLFQGDPAFYKNTTDFFKRAKEVWSPGLLLDTTAKYTRDNGDVIEVPDTYRTKYINDTEISSYDLGKDILNGLIGNGVDEVKAHNIASRFGYYNYTDNNGKKWAKIGKVKFKTQKTNVTDAQGFITLDRYRDIQIGLGRWTDKLDKAYDELNKGRSADVTLQPLKPFMFTHRKLENLIVPTQNKNSEFLLLPALAYNTEAGVRFPTKEDRDNNYNVYKSPILAKVLDSMQRDSFEDNNFVDSIQFDSAVKVGLSGNTSLDNIENAEMHELSNEDYRLQQETPDHYTEDFSIIGTQGRKLIISDISDGIKFDLVNLGEVEKDALLKHYQDVVSADILEAFNEVDERFQTLEDIQKLLLEEVRKREMGPEMEEALTIDKANNRFVIPLFSPIQSRRVESLIGSVFKNKVVKQKAPGGNVVQVSGVGFIEGLEMVVKDGRLQEVQVMLPWWMREKYEPLLDENGELDPKALEKADLDRLIGYRIPTEDKYSMLPLKIVGFMPKESGGAIMLPPEITTLTGSDFDIDKMYLFLPSFKVTKINRRKFKSDLKQAIKEDPQLEQSYELSKDNLDIIIDQIENGEQILNPEELPIYDFYQDNKDKFGEPSIERIKYDYNKDALEQPRRARDNAKLDIYWSVLTNKDTFEKIINPGNFDDVKELADEVNDILKPTQELELSSLRTSRTMFVRNMDGNGLIGIAANHNVNHAIVQHSKVSLKPEHAISLNGISKTSLHEVKNEDGDYISRDIAQLLAAFVDNAKEPVSNYLNINPFTADVTIYLIKLGFSLRTVMGFINQPYIRKLSNKFRLSESTNADYKDIMGELRAELDADVTIDPKSITQDQLFDDIGGGNTQEFKARQKAVLSLFDKAREHTFSMGKLIRTLRADNLGRQIVMSSNEIFQREYNDVFGKDTIFENVASVWDGFPMMRAFYENAVVKTSQALSKYMLWNNPKLYNTKTQLYNNLTENKNLNQNQLDYINYELLHFITMEYFGEENLDYILKQFPKDFDKGLEKYPELKNNRFVKLLGREDKKASGNAYDTLTFRNTGSLTHTDKAEISRAWMDMIENPQHNKFAENLIKYAIFSNGYHLNNTSFNHLIPVQWYYKNNDFSDFLYKLQEETKSGPAYTNFVDQFYRNNWENEFYVPTVSFKEVGISTPKDSVALPIDKFEQLQTQGSTEEEIGMAPYITLENDQDNKFLYALTKTTEEFAIYERTEPLGVKNVAKEYFNKEGLVSVFSENAIKESKQEEVTGEFFGDSEVFPSENEVEEQKKHCKGK